MRAGGWEFSQSPDIIRDQETIFGSWVTSTWLMEELVERLVRLASGRCGKVAVCFDEAGGVARRPVYAVAMPIESRQLESGVWVVALSGRLSLGAEVEGLDGAVSQLVQQEQKKIVLDLAALEYCDSLGVGMLVSCLSKVKQAAGEMRMAGANPRIQRILQMTGVDNLMSMFGTLSEATSR